MLFKDRICRVKQEDILQSAEASREALQGRVREQEVSLEQSFDTLDINLQVRFLLFASLSSCPKLDGAYVLVQIAVRNACPKCRDRTVALCSWDFKMNIAELSSC